MSASDAIVVGEGWISEHYFTTDATSQSFHAKVLERRKAYDEEAAQGRATARSRFSEARQRIEVELGSIAEVADTIAAQEVADGVHERILAVLGIDAHGLRAERQGRVMRVSAPGIGTGAPLAIVLATSVDTIEDLLAKEAATLPEPVTLGEDAAYTSAARLVSALFVQDDAPLLVLVLAGRWILLAERERWAEGRYLAVDIQLVCERNDTRRGGEIDRMLACLAAESIAPDADGDLWWNAVLEESIKHTVGVSQDLRDGVRLSIEILANEVVARRRDQGREPLRPDQAQPLAKQSLRFLYRILFLLYAEASPELGVLPIGAPEYAQGYSLDRLRELVQVELATPGARSGTHLYESLDVLFRLIDQGHRPEAAASTDGLTFNPLRADLFRPAATALIDEVGLGNAALQEVLAHLLLSKESRGRDRGFISYAELGINQLGAVYEGLMSYTGFFAETDLYEVAKGGDASKGSWVVPVDRADGISAEDFVRAKDRVTGEPRPVIHQRGTFVFRLAGRERQQSASYYTPEVLTRFTVGQALAELLDQGGTTTSAREILGMTVCEPALGSGAFAIEAVRQLAEEYLHRRQRETGERIDPDDYPRRLQQVKAYLALHSVYGVDLNATAVELAEISLWLDTMVEGLDAPWFGLHLRRGNSLIGARRVVFGREQVARKEYLKEAPRDVPVTALQQDIDDGTLATDVAGSVHHFLLPAAGWGSAVDAREARELAPGAHAALKAWRSSVQAKPSKAQVDVLVDLAYRVESLWQVALQRLRIAEDEIRRAIDVWGADDLPAGGAVQREQIEQALADRNGAYQRLRRIMDAWCALWFWPLTDTLTDSGAITPPTLADWIDALQMLLGRHQGKGKNQGNNQTLAAGIGWNELGDYEELDLAFASAMPIDAITAKHPWLKVCEEIANQQGFFHWDLDFATVFANGGFDLQVGNPPWVRPDWDEKAALAEYDVRWALDGKIAEAEEKRRRAQTLEHPDALKYFLDSATQVMAMRASVSDRAQYPLLAGLRPDLYRCFMEQTWRHASHSGTIGLIHLESHFTDDKGGPLRAATYRRLRRHWQFINEFQLFEIQHQKTYGVNIYGSPSPSPAFLHATSLYHPDTVLRSLAHDGTGGEPGIKDPEGHWDVRPHRDRITHVNEVTLGTWHELLEDDSVPIGQTRMVYAVNRSTATVLDKLAHSPRMSSLNLAHSLGWDETADFRKGYFASSWGAPDTWAEVILQGPHLYVATPLYKSPNKTMLHHLDWTANDLEELAPDAIPVTSYKPTGDRAAYDRAYTHWGTAPTRAFYRVAWRSMAANTGERTLIQCVIPPGTAHLTQSIYSAGLPHGDLRSLAASAGWLASLIADFFVRAAPKSSIPRSIIDRIPFNQHPALIADLQVRALRLNCVTNAYAQLWADCFGDDFYQAQWTDDRDWGLRRPLGNVGPDWTPDTPMRIAVDRRQALVEIDALVALMLGVTADELCTIYRTQFAVLYGYDRNVYLYDANGRLVPNSVLTAWRRKGSSISLEERTATNASGNTYVYELPFVALDREADMRQAYAHFADVLQART